MEIQTARFIKSYGDHSQMSPENIPEFAFIGRSNVGKSSLVNMLCNNKSLAKTSSTPGKTKLINQFKVNNNWYLVDLPGYGYARVSKTDKKQFDHIITNYIAHRQNLYCLFVLIDSRLPPQQIDVEFIHKCGELGLPIGLIFTKSDKDKGKPVAKNVETMKTELLKRWDELPPTFISSAIKGTGKTEILGYIENAIDLNSEI